MSSESWMFINVCDSVKTLWFECYQSDCKSVNKACPAQCTSIWPICLGNKLDQHSTINIVPEISEDSDSSEVNVVKVEVMNKGSLRESWWPLGDIFGIALVATMIEGGLRDSLIHQEGNSGPGGYGTFDADAQDLHQKVIRRKKLWIDLQNNFMQFWLL